MSFTDRIMVVLDGASGGAVRELDRVGRSAKQADSSVATLGKTLKQGFVAGAGAIVGAGLVAGLGRAVDQYADAAKAAGELAETTGGTVEGVSRMQAALQDAGLSAQESAFLLTKFTTQAGENGAELSRLGVTLKKNKDGSVDYQRAMVDTVDAINKVGDSSKRNQLLVDFFGKKGAAAFNELAASGVSLADAAAAVSKYRVFTPDDVAAAVRYDDAVDALGASMQGLAFTAGRTLIPALSGAAEGANKVLEAASAIPEQVYLAGAAFAAFKVGAAKVGPTISAAVSEGMVALTGLGAAVDDAGGRTGLLKKGMGGIVSAVGPVNLAMAGLAAAAVAVSIGAENADERFRDFVVGMKDGRGAIEGTARSMLETSSAWERFWATLTNSDQALNPGTWTRILNEALNAAFNNDSQDAADAYIAKLRQVQEELGATAAKSLEVETGTRSLTDMLLDGTSSAQQIADAARNAAGAQGELQWATREAERLMGVYATTIQGVAQWQETLASSTAGLESQLGTLQDTLSQVGSIVDDPSTWENEVVLNTAQAEADLWKYIGLLDSSGLTKEQIIPLLVDLRDNKGLTTDGRALVQGIIDAINGAPGAEVPVGAKPDGSVESTKTALENLGKPQTAQVTVTTVFPDGGYAGAKARADYLAQTRQGRIDVAHTFTPDGYNALKQRSDFLAQNRNGRIGIDVAFTPGGYNDIKARVDYLARDRTATIRINTVGLAAARAAVNSVSQNSLGRAAANLSVSPQFQPVNMVRVQVDGRELRSLVDDEIRALTPHRQEVA